MDVNEQKKYIRTLAGDMETLKKGGVPDLTPLPPPPKATEGTVPAPALESSKPSPLETYASDFSDRMKETSASPATVLAAEQDAAPEPPHQPEQKSRGGLLYIFAGVAFLGAGGFGVYFAYTNYFLPRSAPVVFMPIVPAPIFVDEREQISGTGTALLQAIKQSIDKPLASGAVRLLYTANATATDNSVFSALQEPAPNILLRNINAKDSMAGIIDISDTQNPFFILSVASYSETFSGMLSWEPLMQRDLGQLFSLYAIASTTATTTTAGFSDEVVNNHDVRIYRDAEGRSILLYGYWNQTTLIIARDPAAFAEIIGRLATSRSQL